MDIESRPDLKEKNWQMGEVTSMAARRLKRYMRSRESGMRTYDADQGASNKASHKFYFPKMQDADFVRFHKLPGVKEYIATENATGKRNSKVPWHFHRSQDAEKRWNEFPHAHKDERMPDFAGANPFKTSLIKSYSRHRVNQPALSRHLDGIIKRHQQGMYSMDESKTGGETLLSGYEDEEPVQRFDRMADVPEEVKQDIPEARQAVDAVEPE